MSVVPSRPVHTPSIKELVNVKGSIRIVGERKEPSKEALERFVEIYLDMVKHNAAKNK